MIDIRLLESVITEQQQELDFLREEKRCSRIEEGLIDIESKMAQVVVGVRRSGKSTLCMNRLLASGVDFAYVNFDDERLANVEADDLNNILEILYKLKGGKVQCLFFDEIQNVYGWHLFVNRLLRVRKTIVITGSNAKLLGGELATHLTGRNEVVELFPFSFRDYCEWLKLDLQSLTTLNNALIRKAFDEYLDFGGFPEILMRKRKGTYIKNLVDQIIMRDIEQRHDIKYAATFEQLTNHLLNVAPILKNEQQLAKQFGIKSTHTVANYINFLKQSYLLSGLARYTTKSRLRMRSEKLYPIDVTFLDARQNAMSGENLGWRLETIVYIELLRRNRQIGNDIYYYRNDSGVEADFIVCKGNTVIEVYQVCYDLSSEKTMSREIRGLLTAAKETKCTNLFILTDTRRDTVNKNGLEIKVIPTYDWLLNR